MPVVSVLLVLAGVAGLVWYVYHAMYRKRAPIPVPVRTPEDTVEMKALRALQVEVDRLRQQAEADPENPVVTNELAAKSLELGDARIALVYATRAVMARRDPVYLNNLGRAHLGLGNIDAACQAFTAAHALDPLDPGFWFNMAQTLRLCGQYQDAEDELDMLLERHPEHHAAYAEKGVLLHNRKRDSEAVKYLERLVAENPDIRRYRLTLIQVLCDCGHFSVARPHIQWLQERGENIHVNAQHGAYSVSINGRPLYEGLLA